MIYRNFIAPSRAFSQFSHEIIRHPRLDSHAARLLTWQLSLPSHARETLSETAKRARIGACSFNAAKRQLKAEGYLHERRVQGAGGLWATQQLVSSSPLRPEEAAKIFARMPVAVGTDRVFPQVAPEPRKRDAGTPAAGCPVSPSTDGHPGKDPGEDTSNLPPGAEAGAEPEGEVGAGVEAEAEVEAGPEVGVDSGPEVGVDAGPEVGVDAGPEADAGPLPELPPPPAPAPDDPRLEEARALVGALPLLSPALRHIPPGMRDELALLVARWLAAGHTSADVHEHVLRGLPGAGTPVHRPGGLVRYLLRAVPPRAVPPAPRAGLSPRLEGAQECASGLHTQPMLFRPAVAGQTLCPACATCPSS
ncbi:hypothetical protein OG361_22590 [Streptomyces sp. NBC_00090]|uniref:hypothetical protein n=1 Tax=Streptomyces sp. NBC_00090 TaxID=2903619 RepID=UPI00324FFB0B